MNSPLEPIVAELDVLASRLAAEAVNVVRGGRAMLGEAMTVASRLRSLSEGATVLVEVDVPVAEVPGFVLAADDLVAVRSLFDYVMVCFLAGEGERAKRAAARLDAMVAWRLERGLSLGDLSQLAGPGRRERS